MGVFVRRKISKGKYIIRQGTHGTSAFIIERGTVEVFQIDANGDKKELAVLKEKDVFGEMALISDCVRTANVRALEDCVVSVLTQEIYKKLPPDNPGIKRIRSIMTSRLSQMKNKSNPQTQNPEEPAI
ncbi:MAG: cyclic nucleotide-binding domain-containing protein [Candidatus Nitronauta litoralis]|uniref:Cyclic nucleotide-binding domain-containing protein n=1 Tax=Candidatus Nitronauta litoralis TaxID=2705533 RepID=A0A7T0BUD1_9BACT|nr:MAG: cyclic nucleotide-binding domain-containing protein [Candidatus Nitronauta litoralis]